MKSKKIPLLIFLLLAGLVVAGVITIFTENISFLSWLSYGQEIGIGQGTPLVLDLVVITLTFGLGFRITLIQIVCLIVSLLLYKKLR